MWKIEKNDGQTKILKKKKKLAQKQYKIVALGIFITNFNLKKVKKRKEKIMQQNANIYTEIIIEM